MKLNKIMKLSATLVCETGLHIGGGDSQIHIGGIDNEVVKNPVTLQPYIPGSSLKGKIRSLLEWKSGVVQEGPFDYKLLEKTDGDQKECVRTVLKLFGIGGNSNIPGDAHKEIGPTRLSFWDCSLTEEWVKYIQEANLLFTEAKSENNIKRISGEADPRQMERVPAGTKFDFALSIKVLDVDNEEKLLKEVISALKLLELDSLGGSGSRGYGKVKFEDIKVENYNGSLKFDEITAFN